MRPQLLLTGAILSGFMSAGAFANTQYTQVGRYLTVNQQASQAQTNPLDQVIQIHMPSTVGTVGDAISFILGGTSYELLPAQSQTNQVKTLLSKPLPLSDQSIGPISVSQSSPNCLPCT